MPVAEDFATLPLLLLDAAPLGCELPDPPPDGPGGLERRSVELILSSLALYSVKALRNMVLKRSTAFCFLAVELNDLQSLHLPHPCFR